MILTDGMAHPRKLIRQAVVSLLTSANTAAGTRVKGTRVEPMKSTQLPALAVYALHEDIDENQSAQTAPRELERTLQLEIAGFVAHRDSYVVDDAMDDLAEQIEAAMDSDPYLGGKAGDSLLINTVMQVLEDDKSDPLIGIVVLTYSVTFRTYVDTTLATDDFITAHVTQQPVGGVADTAPVVDQFQEPQ